MQIVALEEGLDNLGELLRGQGYQVVSLEECQNYVDAIVYGCYSCELEGPPSFETLASAQQTSFSVDYINVKGMDPEEALDLIKYRLGN